MAKMNNDKSENKEEEIKDNVSTEEAEKEVEEQEKEAKTEKKETDADKLSGLQSKYDELTAKYLLLSADFDNYRKRMIKERAELLKTAGSNILEGLLPVMDNFDRAVQSMEQATDVPSLREGVSLIYSEFSKFLEQNGVKEIPCVGEMFTTDTQEAIAKVPVTSEEDKGKVIDCARKGYTLNGKVIRFARVVVGD